ncbi:MAG: ATP-binding protein [Vicinamibacterales bacterium]
MQTRVPIADASWVGEARRAALRLAVSVGLGEARRGDAAIVATELASNLARHAERGHLLLQGIRSRGGEFLEMVAVDSGPGIANLQRCLQDGYSTGGTAGTGFGAVRRLSDEFDAFSTPGKGTVVVARLRAKADGEPTPFIVGTTCLPAPHESVCGDTWRVSAERDRLAVMVADGLGHGPGAEEAALLAADVFARDPFSEDTAFYAAANAQLGRSRGAAVARAIVRPDRDITFASIGNVAGTLLDVDGRRGFPSQNGIVGTQLRSRIQTQTYAWPRNGLLVMHSDGLTSRWSLDEYPGLLLRHPATIATILSRDFSRGRDDATAVVVRCAEGHGAC